MEAHRRQSNGNGRADRTDPWAVPVLSARRGGPAERFAGLMRGRHPAAVFFAALLAAFAVVAGLSTLLGLLVTDVLLDAGSLKRADESFVKDLVRERSPSLTDASYVGSTMAGGVVLPILVGLIALACAIARRWRIAAFVVFALVVESATYRVTSMLAPRKRPEVDRLEQLPVDASYPSGHTAASIAVYAGLALLLTSRFPNGRLRVVAWTIAVLIPIFVALSRMYRGMHHPLDVAGGMLIGIAALCILLFATRAAGAAAERRASSKHAAPASTQARRPQPVV
jgi:membrane-associated phospholipid phosphatase